MIIVKKPYMYLKDLKRREIILESLNLNDIYHSLIYSFHTNMTLDLKSIKKNKSYVKRYVRI